MSFRVKRLDQAPQLASGNLLFNGVRHWKYTQVYMVMQQCWHGYNMETIVFTCTCM